MAEELTIIKGSKEDQYASVLFQIEALIEGEEDWIAKLANASAALKQQFGWWWVGFYLVKEEQLVLGPFQGPIACMRIKRGSGVCGKSWQNKEKIIVQDVALFDGHIVCSNASKSEIVVPIFNSEKNVCAVLDADSEHFAHFDEVDKKYLEKLCEMLRP